MASIVDDVPEILQCPVCYEEFEEAGDHVPRILPCSHTLCESCIPRLIEYNRLSCPICKKRHDAGRAENRFPQNIFTLELIRTRSEMSRRKFNDESRRCPDHEKNEKSLFCRDPGCQKAICTLCFSRDHRGHTVVAIEEEAQEVLAVLLENIEATNEDLNKKIVRIALVSEDVIARTESSLEHLKKKKEEVMKDFDKMITDAANHRREVSEISNNELAVMEKNLNLLSNMRRSIEEGKENTYEETLRKLDEVREMAETAGRNLPKVKKYGFSEYRPTICPENHVGELVTKYILVFKEPLCQGQSTASLVLMYCLCSVCAYLNKKDRI